MISSNQILASCMLQFCRKKDVMVKICSDADGCCFSIVVLSHLWSECCNYNSAKVAAAFSVIHPEEIDSSSKYKICPRVILSTVTYFCARNNSFWSIITAHFSTTTTHWKKYNPWGYHSKEQKS